MIKPEMIPDEVVEAAAKAAYENQRTRKWDRCGYVGQQQLRRDARAAIVSAMNAWPEGESIQHAIIAWALAKESYE